MRLLLTSTAFVALLGAGTAQAQENCTIPSNYDAPNSQLETLHDAAVVLRDMGQGGACMRLVGIIRDASADRSATNTGEMATETAMNSTDQMSETDEADTMEKVNRARPIGDANIQFDTTRFEGDTLLGADGESIGTIDGLQLRPDGEPAYVIVAFGGFLGFGENHAAVPYEKLRVFEEANSDDITFVLPMTADAMKNSPRFETDNTSWFENDDWRDQNDSYYEENLQQRS